MAKLKPGEKRAQLSFQRPEDVRLYAFLEKRAYENRWDVPTLILMSLQEAFKGQIEDAELDALAAEAARKVRERATPPAEPPHVRGAPEPPPAPELEPALTEDEEYRQGQEHVARMAAMAPQVFAGKGKKRGAGKGVPVPPPPPE